MSKLTKLKMLATQAQINCLQWPKLRLTKLKAHKPSPATVAQFCEFFFSFLPPQLETN